MGFARHGALVLAISACAMNPAPVPVVGDSWGIQDLAGEWRGEYEGRSTNRTGSIVFRLAVGHDTATGDVVMAPRLRSFVHRDNQVRPVPPADLPQTLVIRFVLVEDNQVSGTIEPYRSPDCECLLNTSFTGVRRGDRIEGTYVTQHRECDMRPEHGVWWAQREASNR